MSVEFMIRHDDVVRFLEQAEKDKAPEGKEWTVYLTARGKKSSFLAGSTKFECPLYSIHDGRVKMPISCLAEVAHWGWPGYFSGNKRMGNTQWAEMTFIDGSVKYGLNTCNNDRIVMACSPGNYEHYPTRAEIILLSRLLDPETVGRVGLTARIPNVLSKMEMEIASAFRALERYGVTEDDVREIVEKAFKRTEPVIAESSFYRWCKRSAI